ncbi:MAG TPA: NAD-dependent epimerase/dehydratase family protein [Anaerolineae bacterium]|nr:NAD-dependent epimerase/dehydratase family protein [Anaerolineae bacterium]
MKRVLVTGAVGQIGSELTVELRRRFGNENVVATGHRAKPSPLLCEGPFEYIDVSRRDTVLAVVDKYQVDTIYHMAAILSAVGEKNPALAWDVNINGLYNILEVARERSLTRVFCPSSIAAFGPDTPRDNTPQETVLRPTTMYGVTKVAGELLCDYYVRRYGVDVRGVRYPGIISAETLPGGGTTDYAVAIYYEAVEKGRYTCFVREDTVLPMMYMPDCIKGTLDLMEADFSRLKHHSDFNLAAMSFSAGELATAIRRHIPGFVCTYEPDFRQAIADSWPRSIDDGAARSEWGWQPAYDLEAMTVDMLSQLQKRHAEGRLYPGGDSCS